MEGIQKSLENVENLSEWRKLKEDAPQEVDTAIQKIEGFEAMSSSNQISALTTLLHTLENDNKNRYLYGEIVRRIEIIKENERHVAQLRTLEMVA